MAVRIALLSQGPVFEASSAPYRLLTGWIRERCGLTEEQVQFRHFSEIPTWGTYDDARGARRGTSSVVAMPTAAYATMERIAAWSPDMLALSMYCWNTPFMLMVAAFLKAHRPSTVVVAGGPDVMGVGDSLMQRHAALDFVIEQQGELPFGRLVAHLLGREVATERRTAPGRLPLARAEGLAAVPFLTYRRDGVPIRSASREVLEDLTEIPSPILGRTAEELRTVFYREEDAAVIVETSRGCPVDCAFCQYPKGQSGAMRYFEIERVMSELAHIRAAGVASVYFGDGILTVQRDRARRIFEYFLNEFTEGTLHTEIKLDMLQQELIPLCRELFHQRRLDFGVGIQTTNQATLKRMGRPTKLDRVQRTYLELGGDVCSIRWDLIYGLPGDDFELFLRSVADVHRIAPRSGLSLQRLQVLPGTEYSEAAQRFGIVATTEAPYFVLCADTFSAADLARAERFALAYNSGGFHRLLQTLQAPSRLGIDLTERFPSAIKQVFDIERGGDAVLTDIMGMLDTLLRLVREEAADEDQKALGVEVISWQAVQALARHATRPDVEAWLRALDVLAAAPPGHEERAGSSEWLERPLREASTRFAFDHDWSPTLSRDERWPLPKEATVLILTPTRLLIQETHAP